MDLPLNLAFYKFSFVRFKPDTQFNLEFKLPDPKNKKLNCYELPFFINLKSLRSGEYNLIYISAWTPQNRNKKLKLAFKESHFLLPVTNPVNVFPFKELIECK
jgi:hypothetical protein